MVSWSVVVLACLLAVVVELVVVPKYLSVVVVG